MRSIEAFIGAGGLGLGLAMAGFRHELVVDEDAEACRTIRLNQALGNPLVQGWKVVTSDVRLLDLGGVEPEPDLLAGGVPCQPFGIGGKNAGEGDARDMWPTTVRLVRQLRPKGFLFENVPNLATTHAGYYAYVLAMLANPELTRLAGEDASGHAARLAGDAAAGSRSGLHYRVAHATIEASDHGTAQRRRRLFTVGLRSDTAGEWQAPAATHSQDELFAAQWITGRYWAERGLPRPDPDARTSARIRAAGSNTRRADLFDETRGRKPHRTVRDAIGDLPEPRATAPAGLPGHVRPGRDARAYGTRHAGAGLDEPAKTLRAGVHGVSGGANMFRDDNGRHRHFTVREGARLQDFPDHFEFSGGWSAGLRQLGNAVPCALARAVGTAMARALQ